MNTNQKKANQLGMPFGTASNRLKKLILFKLLVDAGLHQCFKCKEDIGNVDELSIEHIEPWFNINSELFWDLDNIAFSHKDCNRPHVYHGGTYKRKIGPEGTVWCSSHQDFLPQEKFWKSKTTASGFRTFCIDCEDSKRGR